ncbi:tetratricopeptide repeat protein [Cryobacterium sp. Y50]|uniref:tetratricopeptide repeat protein n=1 Tax=Cryobacterium sp. Y50 TaxID=2048286 RepID=UPI000CE4D8EA|nr:tetratricopeptide repeat protein [Cryobacterium sp. Y50]
MLDSPHNWVIQVLLAGGIPLLVVVVGLLVTAAVVGLSSWRRLGVPEPLSAAARRSTGGLVSADVARSDVLAGAFAALGGFGVALLTHFTAPSTTIVAALLLGALVTRAPVGGLRVRLRSGSPRLAATAARTVLLGVWSIWLVILVSAEMPLALDVSHAARGDIQAAESAFDAAYAIRPWDADLAGIAAQSFAAAADARVPGAATLAVYWAERSRAALPHTTTTERALAVGQFADGNATGAVKTLDALVKLAPTDPTIAVQNAIALYTNGDTDGALREVKRALALDPTNEVALHFEEILLHE